MALISAIALLVVSSLCSSAEYSLDYRVESRGNYRDNVGMSPDRSIDISGVTIKLPTTFMMRTEESQASILAEVSTSKFDESGYDSNDQDFQGRYRKLFERGFIDLGAGLVRASTRDTAFFDTGVVGFSASRVERSTAKGSMVYSLSEKNRLLGGLNYRSSTYESPRFQDSSIVTAYSGMEHSLSSRLSLRAQLNGTYFQNESRLQAETVGIGAQAGFSYAASELMSFSLLAGILQSNTEYSPPPGVPTPEANDNRGYLATGAANYRGERFTLSANLRSNASDTGNGSLVQATSLDTVYSYAFTERASLKLGLLAAMQRALDDRIPNDRDYGEASVEFGYKVTQYFKVVGRYAFRYQDRETREGAATENTVYLSIIYNPEKKIWSR